MLFNSGYWTVGRWGGTAVRLHWTVALFALYFGGFRFAPGVWLGYILLVLAHEAGHAWFVRRYRYKVISIDVHGMGGVCHWYGNATRDQHIAIAWGGVLAQAALYVAAYALTAITGVPDSPFVWEVLQVFSGVNLTMIALNLIPIPPLDGALAWQIVPRIWARLRQGRSATPKRSSWAAPREDLIRSQAEADRMMEELRRDLEERKKK